MAERIHITDAVLQEYIDTIADESLKYAVEEHLKSCSSCTARLMAFRELDRAIRKIPLERVSRHFTPRVMAAVGIRRSESLMRQIAMNLLPLAATIVIAVILIGLFSRDTEPEGSLSKQGREYIQTFDQRIVEVFSTGTAVLFDWTLKAVDLSQSVPSVRLIVGLALVFAVIAFFDEFIFLPMMKRRG